jgi:LacI family transcriptional regulator, gluconate utilization system Gnt-I transcriptional repressor
MVRKAPTRKPLRKRKRNGETGAPRAARLEEVARMAGVSPITVSRALRNPGIVAEETRGRIARAVKKIGYVRNFNAGALASSKTTTIGIIVPTIMDIGFSETIHGFYDTLGEQEYQLLLGVSDYSEDEEERLVRDFLAHRAAGVILTGVSHGPEVRRLLTGMAVPTVEFWGLTQNPIDLCIGFSNFDAAYAMTRHLVRLGYKKIAFVSPLIGSAMRDNDRTRDRREGHRKALRDSGLGIDENLFASGRLDFQSGAAALVELIEKRPDIEAIFFGNDVMAAGALMECQKRGWQVPKKVAIAGFGDSDLSTVVQPALTTVRIPRHAMGERAAELLLERIAGNTQVPKIVDLGFDVIQREST